MVDLGIGLGWEVYHFNSRCPTSLPPTGTDPFLSQRCSTGHHCLIYRAYHSTLRLKSISLPKAMAILQTATQPVKDRPTCFLENDDLGILGCASTSLYKVVSIALTLWAIWDPYVPGGGQMVGSPLVLDRFFQANTSEYQVVSITRSSSEEAVSVCSSA